MKVVPKWSEYFMEIAKAVSKRSKDPQTQVGCVIVNKDNHIIGTGFNGFPKGCVETEKNWERPEKYKWVIHAELNSLLHSTSDVKGATLYTTLYPCPECSKAISSAGIKKVVYLDDKYKNDISEKILKEMSGIAVIKLGQNS